MARLTWTERAIGDLSDIAEYIALDNPDAARRLVKRVFDHVGQLAEHPLSGPVPPEIPDKPYRQIIEPPCRVIYRVEDDEVLIVHVIRSERLLRLSVLDEVE